MAGLGRYRTLLALPGVRWPVVAQGRLMDRLGQPRVLRTTAAAHAVAVAGLVLAALGAGIAVVRRRTLTARSVASSSRGA